MIEAHEFLARLRDGGRSWYAGVPCSFLSPIIDSVIADDTLDYVGAANEGDAVAMAAGACLGGRPSAALMQNSGLGNAVSPITSLTYPFRIPLLLLVTLRGAPGLNDEPQHELMGRITGDLLDAMEVPWLFLPRDPGAIDETLARADEHMAATGRPFALVVRKGTVARRAATPDATDTTTAAAGRAADGAAVAPPLIAYPPCPPARGGTRPTRTSALRHIVDATDDDGTVVIATTGYTGRELYAIADRPQHLYVVGSMGCASSLGLGLALARPDLRVVVADGDGAALMRMGNLATIGAQAGTPGRDASNLVHVLLDNGVHDSTGGQATVAPRVCFAGIARARGYTVHGGHGIEPLERALADDAATGPRFAHIRIRPGAPAGLPRPRVTPADVRARLMEHIGAATAVPASGSVT